MNPMIARCSLLGCLALASSVFAADAPAPAPTVLHWLQVDSGPVAVASELPAQPSHGAKWGNASFATVEFVVNEQGTTEAISVPDASEPTFAQAATDAVAKWVFRPGMKAGQMVRTRLQVRFVVADRKVHLDVPLTALGSYTGTVVRGPEVVPPKPVFQARPDYPPELRRAGTAGRAVLRFVITEKGEVANVKLVSTTHPAFAVAATNALVRWRYTPAQLDGRDVAVEFAVPFNFDLNDGAGK